MIDLLKNRLWPYLSPYRGRVTLVVIFAFLLAFIGAAQTYLIKPLFDKGLNPNGSDEDAYVLAACLLGLGLLNFP